MKYYQIEVLFFLLLLVFCSSHQSLLAPIVWTIAGSDSGGGAGIQADLKVFHSLGCHGCTVITATTAQNSHHVSMIEPSSPLMIKTTIKILQEDLPPKCIKLGMLSNKEIMEEVSEFLSLNKKSNSSTRPPPWQHLRHQSIPPASAVPASAWLLAGRSARPASS